MCLCFVTGSARDKYGKPYLRVSHSIEYLSFDLEKREVRLCGDFLVRNVGDRPACLRGLHRGNIPFRAVTGEWFSDKTWTPVLLRFAGEQVGLRESAGKLYFQGAMGDPIHVSLLPDPPQGISMWGAEHLSGGRFAYFTGWESPEVEPNDYGLFRVAGTVAGETYDRLLPDTAKINITGGNALLEEIRRDLEQDACGYSERDIKEYQEEYSAFEEEMLAPPDFYHLFFERIGPRSLGVVGHSSDIQGGCDRKPFDGRIISWYWSDSDFNIYVKANGPVLELRDVAPAEILGGQCTPR